MMWSDLYMEVGKKCPAYKNIYCHSLDNIDEKQLISCISCENFKLGACIVNYYDIIAINLKNER